MIESLFITCTVEHSDIPHPAWQEAGVRVQGYPVILYTLSSRARSQMQEEFNVSTYSAV